MSIRKASGTLIASLSDRWAGHHQDRSPPCPVQTVQSGPPPSKHLGPGRRGIPDRPGSAGVANAEFWQFLGAGRHIGPSAASCAVVKLPQLLSLAGWLPVMGVKYP